MATLDFNVAGVLNKVPVLGDDNKVPSEHLKVLGMACNQVTRTLTTRYANTTGFPIMLHVLLAYSATTTAGSVRVGNTSANTYVLFESPAVNTNHSQPIFAVIPPGGWYEIHNTTGHTIVRVIECTQAWV